MTSFKTMMCVLFCVPIILGIIFMVANNFSNGSTIIFAFLLVFSMIPFCLTRYVFDFEDDSSKSSISKDALGVTYGSES